MFSIIKLVITCNLLLPIVNSFKWELSNWKLHYDPHCCLSSPKINCLLKLCLALFHTLVLDVSINQLHLMNCWSSRMSAWSGDMFFSKTHQMIPSNTCGNDKWPVGRPTVRLLRHWQDTMYFSFAVTSSWPSLAEENFN